MSASKEIKVGVFVLVSSALLFGGVITLGSGRFFRDTQVIETAMDKSVEGLQVGSPVKFRGVPIGEVSTISFADRLYPKPDDGSREFDYKSPVVIRMKVRVDVFGPEQSELFTKDIARGVDEGLRARLRSAGLTGGVFVELELVEKAEREAQALTLKTDYPFVPSAPSRFDEVLERLNRVSGQLASIDFEKIGGGFKDAAQQLNALLGERAPALLADAGTFIAEMRASNEALRKLLVDPRLEKALDNAASISTDLRVSLPRAVREYSELGAGLNAAISNEEYDIRRLLWALRETAENLEAISERARQDPPHLLFSKPPRKLAPGEIEP